MPTGSGGQNDVGGLDLALATSQEGSIDGVIRFERGSSLDVLHTVLLEEELDAVGQTTHLRWRHKNTVTALSLAFMIAFRSKDTSFTTTPCFFMLVFASSYLQMKGPKRYTHQGRVQKRLGRNAAHVQASTAQGATLLDTGSLQSQLSSLDGSDVTTRTSTDHNNIEPRSRQGREIDKYLSAAAALKNLAV